MDNDPGLYYWLALLRRNRVRVFLTSFLAGVLTLGIVFLLPTWYRGRTQILTPREAQASLLSRVGLEQAIRLESLLPFAAGITLSDVYIGIIESETVSRALIERFDLQTVYKQKTLEKTILALRSNTRVAATLNGTIFIHVDDKDPQRAAALANGYVEELDRIFSVTQSTTARRQREFLEARLESSAAAIDSLQEILAVYQSEQGITALSNDLTEAAKAAGELLGQRLALTVRLQMLDRLGVESAVRLEVETELKALESEMSRLPFLGLDMARRLRDLYIQNHLHFALAEQLEVARLEEVRDTPRVQVLDRAVPPDRHVRPRRGLVTLGGAFLGFGFAFLWAARKERPRA